MLSGTATVQNVTMKTGATYLCTLTASTNSRLNVKSNLTHNSDTLLVSIPSYRKLKEGDELTVFVVSGKHTGNVILKTEALDGTVYKFDNSSLLTDGIIRVKSVATGIRAVKSEEITTAIYDLQGRRMQGTKRGFYIKNGKKINKK